MRYQEGHMDVSRRAMVIGGAAAVTSALTGAGPAARKPLITVYKEPT
jgi:hypothetical protein